MTARVSAVWPSGPHRWPPARIMAGMEASMMTSLGTCRFVMPRSESTMVQAGPGGDLGLDGGADLLTLGQRVQARQDRGQPVLGAQTRLGQDPPVGGEDAPAGRRAPRDRR